MALRLISARCARRAGGVRRAQRRAAAAIAGEWQAQGQTIAPRLHAAHPAWLRRHRPHDQKPRRALAIISPPTPKPIFAATAPKAWPNSPPASAHWDPLIAWGEAAHGLKLPALAGVIAAPADPQTRERLMAHLASLDDFRLTALAQATGLSGSALIALVPAGAAP